MQQTQPSLSCLHLVNTNGKPWYFSLHAANHGDVGQALLAWQLQQLWLHPLHLQPRSLSLMGAGKESSPRNRDPSPMGPQGHGWLQLGDHLECRGWGREALSRSQVLSSDSASLTVETWEPSHPPPRSAGSTDLHLNSQACLVFTGLKLPPSGT